jgi:hypothetical protein
LKRVEEFEPELEYHIAKWVTCFCCDFFKKVY